MTFKSWGRKAEIDPSFRKRLYEAKARLANDHIHNSQLFFREESADKEEAMMDPRCLVFPEFQFGMIDTNLYNRDKYVNSLDSSKPFFH